MPPYHSHLNDEIELARALRIILDGSPKDALELRKTAVTAARLSARLGCVTGENTRAILRVILGLSKHPDALKLMHEIGQPGDIVDWALDRYAQWFESWCATPGEDQTDEVLEHVEDMRNLQSGQ
ncbi:hypothetical protein GS636_06700 [Ruegeria sp. HKCCD4884]|uniref:hypothetical protein n=1 Tax=Ruegeria sp. HKCCD4884 TaxID=2683022 RepID=UPI00149296CE|nr:hypothetical protein [Ruegeria sp. HKCCD4884]NOD92470.1 hypothetical protein [Ruegeria sp. HKCCD4884]